MLVPSCMLVYTLMYCTLCRWWPGLVVPMDDVPDNIVRKRPGEGMFVVRYAHNAPTLRELPCMACQLVVPDRHHVSYHTEYYCTVRAEFTALFTQCKGSVGLTTTAGSTTDGRSPYPWSPEPSLPRRSTRCVETTGRSMLTRTRSSREVGGR